MAGLGAGRVRAAQRSARGRAATAIARRDWVWERNPMSASGVLEPRATARELLVPQIARERNARSVHAPHSNRKTVWPIWISSPGASACERTPLPFTLVPFVDWRSSMV